MGAYRRMVFPTTYEEGLPIYMETIGYNPDQESVVRPHGYPLYHWLQTMNGQGRVTFHGETSMLPVNSGILLFPQEDHRYEAVPGGVHEEKETMWETLYLTFGGPGVHEMMHLLGLEKSAFYSWESGSPFAPLIGGMLDQIELHGDVFGLTASAEAYRFLIMLRKYGQFHNNTSISHNLKRLELLIQSLEQRYTDPDVGLPEMADVLQVSIRQLNILFKDTFGVSPYAYLLNLRLRKAKEMLIGRPDLTVKEITGLTGFRDASHFTATFRKSVGLPPDRFRKLY